MASSRYSTLILLMECCLYYISESTTIVPRCVPGQQNSECNTTDTPVVMPKAAEMRRSKCPASIEGYCLHGDCVYIAHENLHYCRCKKGFSGARCMHFELVQQPMSEEDVALTVAVTFLVFVGLLIASYLIYRRCRMNKSKNQPQYIVVEKNPAKTECKESFMGLNTSPPNTKFQNILYC
ncbi:proepiregulin-like [Heptranchias perlo]|uniref:proepiregulin-like n=1 Tax=Heptranchias perlo TaxID=212740 RepID=UPI003559D32B